MRNNAYTDVLAKRLKALEQEKSELEAKLASTLGGKLDNLPDIVPNDLLKYREKIVALATSKHG